jgi:hypothetical protein
LHSARRTAQINLQEGEPVSNDSNDPKPEGGSAPRKATMLDVQLVMAEAQRAMAQALLALSSGRIPDGVVATPAEGSATDYQHWGVLDLSSGELRLVEFNGSVKTLRSLAEGGKRIRLEFSLSSDELVNRMDDGVAKFTELGDFLRKRASALVLMQATCDGSLVASGSSPPP